MKKLSIFVSFLLVLCSCTKYDNYEITENIFSFDNSDSTHIAINNLLHKRFSQLKSELLKTAREYKNCEKNEGIKYPKIELLAETTIYINTPRFFSARNDYNIYLGGGHGNCSAEGFNIVFSDSGTFENLELFKVFPKNKKEELAKLIIEKLKKTYPEGLRLKDVKKSDDLIKAIGGFVIKNDGIEIFFEKYSVACGACGTAPIFFNFKDLSNYNISLPRLD